jgi:hypothetical protein
LREPRHPNEAELLVQGSEKLVPLLVILQGRGRVLRPRDQREQFVRRGKFARLAGLARDVRKLLGGAGHFVFHTRFSGWSSAFQRSRKASLMRWPTGLEQAFNALDAQREACAAFILSQKHEGWTMLPTLYDDGGFSGGTMERPALKRLMTDIEAGQIDVVVVYKVDRLTRALSDFAKLVKVFDRGGVSFVGAIRRRGRHVTMTHSSRIVGTLLCTAEIDPNAWRSRNADRSTRAAGPPWDCGEIGTGAVL